MSKAGVAIPAMVQGTFLLDTGASGTCVDPRLVAPLALAPSGNVAIQTPSTNGVPVFCNQYDISLLIPGGMPGNGAFYIPALGILETSLSTQGIDGLIGRDVIDRCSCVYNGSAGLFTLSY